MRQISRNYSIRRKMAFGMFVVAGMMFSWSLMRNLVDLVRLGSRLDELRQEVVVLEEENYKLQEQARLVEDPDYVGLQIRDQLGLVKPGETLVIIPEEVLGEEESDKRLAEAETEGEKENWQKWKELFF